MSAFLKKLKVDKSPRLVLLHEDMIQFLNWPETFQQISPRKIAFVEHIPDQHSVSEAFYEKKSRQHSNNKTTGCISASRGMQDEFSRFSVHRMEIVSSRCWYTSGMGRNTKRPWCISWPILYWSRVATERDGLGNPKYNNLMVVVKVALCISRGHWQADLERGFSINKHVVSETRVKLKQHTILAIRTVKDVINKCIIQGSETNTSHSRFDS